MTSLPAEREQTVLSHVKFFFALSRTPHGLLDMATPAVAALLWYGAFPSLTVILLGLMTAFAGYTAVYALNDLVDHRADTAKRIQGGFRDTNDYLDAVLVLHPLAYGLLTFREALVWAIGWALVALAGAYLLNPVCVVIFVVACLLETVYCLMWRTSYLRTLISGAVKTSGGVAAIFAVDPDPSPLFLVLLFFWLFFWEIGGQNIPADWTDIEEDTSIHAATVPVLFGPRWSASIVLVSLGLAFLLNVVLLAFSPSGVHIAYIAASLAAGVFLLLVPAVRLYRSKERLGAAYLFNKASYYPAALLALAIVRLISSR